MQHNRVRISGSASHRLRRLGPWLCQLIRKSVGIGPILCGKELCQGVQQGVQITALVASPTKSLANVPNNPNLRTVLRSHATWTQNGPHWFTRNLGSVGLEGAVSAVQQNLRLPSNATPPCQNLRISGSVSHRLRRLGPWLCQLSRKSVGPIL